MREILTLSAAPAAVAGSTVAAGWAVDFGRGIGAARPVAETWLGRSQAGRTSAGAMDLEAGAPDRRWMITL